MNPGGELQGALAPVCGTRGVSAALLLGESGEVLAGQGELPGAAAVLATARAIASALGRVLGGEMNECLIDFEAGPVHICRAPQGYLLVAFDDVGSLGRLRFGTRRTLGLLARQPAQ